MIAMGIDEILRSLGITLNKPKDPPPLQEEGQQGGQGAQPGGLIRQPAMNGGQGVRPVLPGPDGGGADAFHNGFVDKRPFDPSGKGITFKNGSFDIPGYELFGDVVPFNTPSKSINGIPIEVFRQQRALHYGGSPSDWGSPPMQNGPGNMGANPPANFLGQLGGGMAGQQGGMGGGLGSLLGRFF